MFTYHIQNLEIYNAFIISEPEFTVCILMDLPFVKHLFLQEKQHGKIFILELVKFTHKRT